MICNIYAIMYYIMSNHVVSLSHAKGEYLQHRVYFKTKYKCLTVMNHVLSEHMKFTLF